jgi:predicted amidohydrolase YtcJ
MGAKAFLNGHIYISFRPKKEAGGLLIAGGKVLSSGREDQIRDLAERLGAEIVDLKGKTLLPGFIDSHAHLDEVGLSLRSVDLRGTKSLEELKGKLDAFARDNDSPWILGYGWDQELFAEHRWPTRYDLDAVEKKRPVMLSRVCLHAAVINTPALKELGLDPSSPNVLKGKDGAPSGVIVEEALNIAKERFRRSLTIEDWKEYLRAGAFHAASRGVSTLGFVSCGARELAALIELGEELPLRVRAYLNPERSVVEALKGLGIRRGFGSDLLKIQGIKILADGSLGARTARLSDPYEDDPEAFGQYNVRRDELLSLAAEADKAKLQLAIHGIGDATIDMILDAYEALGHSDLRHRIEHASLSRPDQIERMAQVGIVVTVQPHFVLTDWWLLERVGQRRAKWIYPFRSIMQAGVPVGFGTDSPVEPIDPFETLYAAVTRGKFEAPSVYEMSKEEALTVEESLYCYTLGSAYVMGEEKLLGNLEEGKIADFVVVEDDPLTVDERHLRTVRTAETYLGGRRVF